MSQYSTNLELDVLSLVEYVKMHIVPEVICKVTISQHRDMEDVSA